MSNPSKEEIGHARHRRELADALRGFVFASLDSSGMEVKTFGTRMLVIDGRPLWSHTIADQALRIWFVLDDGRFFTADVQSTGESWDALILITSSGQDLSLVIPQGGGPGPAIVAAGSVLESIGIKPAD